MASPPGENKAGPPGEKKAGEISPEPSLFRLAVEHSPIAMGLADPDGRFREVNRAMEHFCGRDREALLRYDWQSLTHPDDLAPSLAVHRRLLEGDIDHYRLTKRYHHADGSILWGEITVSAVRAAGGHLRGVLFQIVDATEMVRRQEELNRERERLRLVAELGSDLIVMLDTELRCTWVSADSEGRNALGWLASEEIGVSLDQRVHPEDGPKAAQLTATLKASGQRLRLLPEGRG
jgi:PAS domain S-box-containing protein